MLSVTVSVCCMLCAAKMLCGCFALRAVVFLNFGVQDHLKRQEVNRDDEHFSMSDKLASDLNDGPPFTPTKTKA